MIKLLARITSFFSIVVFAVSFILLFYYFFTEMGILKIKNSANNADLTGTLPQLEAEIRYRPCHRRTSKNVFFLTAAMALSSRIVIYILGYMGSMLLLNERNNFFQTFKSIWLRWDADNYILIAQNWYTTLGDKRFAIVFFPFYPIVIRIFSVFIRDYFISGVVVSNLCLCTACYYLYRIVSDTFDEETAVSSVKYLLIFPVSFFLGATFSESLFLALSIMVLYYSNKEKWILAGILGMLAALTRSLGVLLVIPVFIELLISSKATQNIKKQNFSKLIRDTYIKGLAVLMIPFGSFIYLCINKSVTGDWFKFMEYQKEHWHQSFGIFYKNIESFVLNSATWKPAESASLWIPQVFIIVAAMLLLVYGFRRIKISYMAYFFVLFFVSISPTWLLSGPRYIMEIFPIYIILALISQNKFADFLLTFISIISLCYCTLAFVTGHYIM